MMKNRSLVILLILISFNISTSCGKLAFSNPSTEINKESAPAKKKVYVLLFGGQSNALGWGYQQYLLDTKSPLAEAQKDIEMSYAIAGTGYLPEDTIIPLQSGTSNTNVKPAPNHYPNISVAPVSRFGPELSFARTVKDKVDFGESKLVIIKFAQGGTSIYKDWLPDGTANTAEDGKLYKAFHNVMNKGLEAIKAKYPDYELVILGMGWVQGESDALDSRGAEYEKNLANFIADIRLTYGAKLPFVFNKISPQQIQGGKPAIVEQWEVVRKAQDAVASAVNLTATTETLGDKYGVSKGLSEGQYHYTTPALLQIGEDLGNALAEIIKKNKLVKKK